MLKFTSDTTNRLDKFLSSKVDVSRGKVQKAIREGKVTVNGIEILEPDYMVKVEDVITLPEFEKEELKPFDFDLKIVFENDDLAVIDKPAGLVVHPGAGNLDKTLANILISKYPHIKYVGDPHRPGIVHRLDEDTSGLILIAKNQKSLEYFKEQFMDRKVEKEYLTLVHGVPAKLHDIIDAPLEKVPFKQKMKVGSGKEAVTEYWVKGDNGIKGNNGAGQYSLLRVKLHTGRTHQIRAHLSHIGHPIVGDQVYGKEFKAKDERFIPRQFLHAYHLKVQLMDETWLELESPLPSELIEVLKKFKINFEL